MPERGLVRVNEVFRDGIQAVPEDIPLDVKLEYIRRVAEAVKPGATCTIEVTAFVHPRAVPQHRDAAQVIGSLEKPREGITYSVLIPKMKGFDNAVVADDGRGVIGEFAGFTAATRAFLD